MVVFILFSRFLINSGAQSQIILLKTLGLRLTNSYKAVLLQTCMIFLHGQPKQDLEIIPSHGTAETLRFLALKQNIILTCVQYLLKYTVTHPPNSRPHIPAVNLMSKYKLKSQGMWAGSELSHTYHKQFPFVFLIFMRDFCLLQQNWVGSISEEPSSVGNVIGKRSLWGGNGPTEGQQDWTRSI